MVPATKQVSHDTNVRTQLRDLGLSKMAMMSTESHYLPKLIHPDEILGGVVFGKHVDGYAMLVATDRRIIFLDKKPLFVNEDEMTYDVVGGISISRAGIGATVTLHTRLKDYTIRTFNQESAQKFLHYIELRCLEHNHHAKEGSFD
jgi:hypothetical protein